MPRELNINENIVKLEYAVRGPIPQRAAEMKKQGREIFPCNIGNPQALGQEPISYYRQVLSLVEAPSKIERERKLKKLFKNNPAAFEGFEDNEFIPDYFLDLAEKILSQLGASIGAYTESRGPQFIREAVARYIDKRDGVDDRTGVPADPGKMYLTNGASEGVRNVLEMFITKPTDGVMIPIPQYPLYSATIRRLGGTQVNYYPDEDNDWTLSRSELERSISEARKNGVDVKIIVVINPGNPTGAVLDEQSVKEVIEFAKEYNLAIIADEVYQENTYGLPFFSFAKVLGKENVLLFSLHSVSKGFYGECGHRGGYMEVRNSFKVKDSEIDLADLFVKQASVNLCSNTVGQTLTYLMVNPPEEGSEPYGQYMQERKKILDDLHEKATMTKEAFKEMKGVECFGKTGALYLFPRLNLPAGITDFDYCMNLLEATGLSTVNGSGFGQKEGTTHLRFAFLPPKEMLEKVLPEWIKFHNEYVSR